MGTNEGCSATAIRAHGIGISMLEDMLQKLREMDLHDRGCVNANASTAAVIVAGGTGSRFDNPGGKQLFRLLGTPLLSWCVQAFDAVADVGLIVVVCPAERREEYQAVAIEPYRLATPVVFADAGTIRQESAMNGVNAVPPAFEHIAIHDGARPLVTPELVEQAISLIKGDPDLDGVVVGHPSIDTLKAVDGDAHILLTPARDMLWVAQTPQVFRSEICRRAYSSALFEGFVGTDDASLVEQVNGRVRMLRGPRDNIKLTVPEDIGPAVAALIVRLLEGN